MSHTCKCGRGKVSAYDNKCGHCRTNREKLIHKRLLDGWTLPQAIVGYR